MSSETTALARTDERRSAIAAPVPISSQMPLETLAGHLVKAGYFKEVRDVSQAIVKVMYGQELGFPAISSMMGIHIIEGKPVCSATLMASMVKRSGRYNYRVLESTNTRCEIVWFERGEEIGRSVWTIQDATQADLANKQNWKRYPKAMLFSRAVGEGVRMHCADLFGGASPYTDDEARDEGWQASAVNTTTGEVIDVRARMETPAGPPTTARVTAATEREPSYAQATGAGVPTAEPDLKSTMNAVKACLLAIGQTEEQAKAPWEYLGRILDRDNLKRTDLSLDDWIGLHEELSTARATQIKLFQAWTAYRKAANLADDDRMACISDILGQSIESTSLLTPSQMSLLTDVFNRKAAADVQEEVQDAVIVDDGSNPFNDEPEHPRSALAQGI